MENEGKVLRLNGDLIRFPVGENIPCRLGSISRDRNFKGQYDTLLLFHQTEVPEWRDGKKKAKTWVTLKDRYFIKRGRYTSLLRDLYSIALAFELDIEDFPLSDEINKSGGNITEELFEDFLSQYLQKIDEVRKDKTYYLKTVIGNWKGTACTMKGNMPYISSSPELEYLNGEDVYNNQVFIKPN